MPVVDGLEEIGAEQRHYCDRVKIRGEQGDDHSESQRTEQIFAYAEKKCDREKYDHGDQHDRKHRESHFVGAVDRGRFGVLAQFEVPENVLDNDHGIVDQPGESQRQPAQNHGVDGLAHRVQHKKRDHHRQGN